MGEDILLVNDHGHSVLAMLGLRAVDPYWRRVVDHDGICWRCRGRSRHRHEARVETRCAGLVQSDRLAWLGEGGLRDGVVVGRELELHHVADVRLDVVG